MKVIDLLNKIANGEEVPKKIKYKGIVREFDYEDKDYTCKGAEDYYLFHDTLAEGTGDKMVTGLTEKVEIMEDIPEDKKIEYIQTNEIYGVNYNDAKYVFVRKINEIIDKINGE